MEKLKLLLPYAGPVLIFLGILKLQLYYSAFDVSIILFLDFSEILTAFLGDVLVLAFYCAMMLVGTFFTTPKFETSKTGFVNNFFAESSFKRRLSAFIKWAFFPWIFLLNAPFLLSIAILFFTKADISIALWVLFWNNVSISIVFFVYEFRYRYRLRTGKDIDTWFANLTLIFLIILSVLFQRVQSDVRLVKEQKKFANVTFTVGQRLIKSDSSAYYIGNTRNYLFFYDQSKATTTVYPMSGISEITFAK
jgi:hypothetical protein